MHITKPEKISRTKELKEKEIRKYFELSDYEIDKTVIEGILAGLAYYNREDAKPDGTYINLLNKLEQVLKENGGITGEEYEELFSEYEDPDEGGDQSRGNDRGEDGDIDGGDK